MERINLDKFRAVLPESSAEDKLAINKLLRLRGAYIGNGFEKCDFE